MRYKHEKTIKVISMITLITVLILGRFVQVKIQVLLSIISFILCTFSGIYFIRKGSKLGGALMFCFSSAGGLFILGQYCHNDNLVIPLPGIFIVISIIAYKLIVMYGDEDKIRKSKKTFIMCLIILLIVQILLLVPTSIK